MKTSKGMNDKMENMYHKNNNLNTRRIKESLYSIENKVEAVGMIETVNLPSEFAVSMLKEIVDARSLVYRAEEIAHKFLSGSFAYPDLQREMAGLLDEIMKDYHI